MKMLLALTLILVAGNTMAHPASRAVKIETDIDIVPQRFIGNQLLGAMMAALGSRLVGGNSSSETRRSEQEEINKKILQDMQELRTAIAGRTSNISFHVYSSSSSQDVAAGAVVQFGNVMHNVAPSGFGFDTTTNKFRCPVNGTYAFQFSTTTYTTYSKWYIFAIMKESTQLSHAQAFPETSNHHISMSSSAVTTCNRGQTVYVKNVKSYSLNIHGSLDTFFNGFKIY